ncbi:MAG: hypothetical protein L6Q75_19610 [Burkholderiaceae bacterium]|nr:hypothetical protein [Burkholderiaceae bacterium]
MTTAADLEQVARQACDVVNLAAAAAEQVAQVEAGDTYRLPVLGAMLRALLVQAKAMHAGADAQWIAAHRAEQSRAGGAA